MIILGTNSIKDTGYDVANSLRFNDGSSDNLSRTQESSANSKIFTYSTWVKRSGITGAKQEMASGGSASTDFDMFYFDASERLSYYSKTSNSENLDLATSRKFRDPSAWYHIVLSVDTTQGTASNRVKLYVNGVLETAYDVGTYPSVNTNLFLNKASESQRIGRQAYSAVDFFDGYMSETVLIDGQQLAPTSFTCTINFATLNPLGTVQLGTLSEGNLKLVSSSAYKIATSTIAVSNGKWYVENKITGGSPDAMVGVIDVQDYQTNSSINYAGDKTNSVGYYKDGRKFIANSASSYGASYTENDIIGIALDLDSGTKTITFYKNGASQGAINLPTAGSEEWYFLPSPYNATIEVNFGSPPYSISSGNTDGDGYGNFAHAVPSGYYSLNTKNLAEYG